jgi:hypothetical protein
MKKNTTPIPTFQGEKIYRYKLVNVNGLIIYRFVTQKLPQSKVLYYLEQKFEYYQLPISIFCNGEKIKRICVKK